LDISLQEFFRKKRKIDPEDMDAVQDWLFRNANKAKELNFATHNGKYTHTGVGKEMSCIAISLKSNCDGYLRTGNCIPRYIQVLLSYDCLGNAAALGVLDFLSLVLSDGTTIFELANQVSPRLQKELELDNESYQVICQQLMEIFPDQTTRETSDLLKQVYFPVGSDYHLLSLLSPSTLMVELRERIRSEFLFSQNTKDGRDARRKGLYQAGYATIYGLTEISYGGANAQNVGKLNAQSGGTTYVLSSQPPALQERNVRFPKHDFFRECLFRNSFEDRFSSLYKIFETDYNNVRIRLARERIYISIIDTIIEVSLSIRKQQPGWSFREYYASLPLYQRIWLDESREPDRKHSDEWFDKVVENCARWVLNFVPQSRKGSGSPLGEEEFVYIKALIMDTKEALE
jgi:CRISPR-associated protein Csy1